MRRLVLVLILLAAGIVAAPHAAAAVTLPNVVATIATSAGATAEYDPGNETSRGGYAYPNQFEIHLGGGTAGTAFGLALDTTDGAPLHTGTYYRGLNLTVYSGNDACQGGQVTVTELTITDGRITRLDLDFQSDCRGSDVGDVPEPTVVGELELGQPVVNHVSAKQARWPFTPLGTVSRDAWPVRYLNRTAAAQDLGRVGLSGAAPGDFVVVVDHCSGAHLAAGSACLLGVGFRPSVSGSRTATLTLPLGGSVAATAQLTGLGAPGRSLLRYTSDPGEYVGGGRSVVLTDAQTQMHTAGDLAGEQMEGVQTVGAQIYRVSMQAAAGGPLTTGRHTIQSDTRGGFRFGVEAEGRGCGAYAGSVDISQVAFDPAGRIGAIDMIFEVVCAELPGKHLRGEFAYHATTTPQPPSAPFVLRSGQTVQPGASVTNGVPQISSFRLTVTSGGRAELLAGTRLLWASPSAVAHSGDHLVMLGDGRVALANTSGTVHWATPSAGAAAGDFLAVQSDGNLVLYRSDYRPIWATNTTQSVA